MWNAAMKSRRFDELEDFEGIGGCIEYEVNVLHLKKLNFIMIFRTFAVDLNLL